jgi:hypothetical protein
VNGILQTIPSVSTNNPWATFAPLMFVVFLGIFKEALAEFKRWREDRKVNY